VTDAAKPLTDEELDAMESRLEEHWSTLLDRSSSEGGPVSWRNPLGPDVQRLVAEVRTLRQDSFRLAVHHERVSAAVAGPCPVCATLDQQSRSQP
jgi:hypothetical protein